VQESVKMVSEESGNEVLEPEVPESVHESPLVPAREQEEVLEALQESVAEVLG